MSKTKIIYVLHKSHLAKYRKWGYDKCKRCNNLFKENDVVATTSRHKIYCYNCAAEINLTSGNIKNDLQLDVLFSKSSDLLLSLSDKIKVGKNIKKLSLGILQEMYDAQAFFTKNIQILVVGIMYLACRINNLDELESIHNDTKIEKRVIRWSCSKITKLLSDSTVPSLSRSIQVIK